MLGEETFLGGNRNIPEDLLGGGGIEILTPKKFLLLSILLNMKYIILLTYLINYIV